jgi:hypothetical protein
LKASELPVVQGDGTSMAHDQGLSDDPGLGRTVAFGGLRVDAASSWGIYTRRVSLPESQRR